MWRHRDVMTEHSRATTLLNETMFFFYLVRQGIPPVAGVANRLAQMGANQQLTNVVRAAAAATGSPHSLLVTQPQVGIQQQAPIRTPLQLMQHMQPGYTFSQLQALVMQQAMTGQMGGLAGLLPNSAAAAAAAGAEPADENAEEEENMGVAETYADYMPSKLKLGKKHPDPVVETASLASVPPPDVWYKLSLPDETINSCLLSALQLESITYACQQHDQILPDGSRAGYLIGDGAGVGKGRTVSGIIFENYLKVLGVAIFRFDLFSLHS